MEEIYARNKQACELIKAQPETVQFLLNYSKSLHIIDHDGIKLESNKN